MPVGINTRKKKVGEEKKKNPYNKTSLIRVSEENIAEVRDLKERGLSRSAISYKIGIKWSTINNIFRELERRDGENKVQDMIKQLMNNDFSVVKRMAAENIIRALNDGDMGISKWIMEKGFSSKAVPSEEETFGSDKDVRRDI